MGTDKFTVCLFSQYFPHSQFWKMKFFLLLLPFCLSLAASLEFFNETLEDQNRLAEYLHFSSLAEDESRHDEFRATWKEQLSNRGCNKNCGGGMCFKTLIPAIKHCVLAAGTVHLMNFPSVFLCAYKAYGALKQCAPCIMDLVCCGIDSCSICDCGCKAKTLQFQSTGRRPARAIAFLFKPQCKFVYRPEMTKCRECDGKRAYKSQGCAKSMWLHYHDYAWGFGRDGGGWYLSGNVDDGEKASLMRNLGDGWDDEECPELETTPWQFTTDRYNAGTKKKVAWTDATGVKVVGLDNMENALVKELVGKAKGGRGKTGRGKGGRGKTGRGRKPGRGRGGRRG